MSRIARERPADFDAMLAVMGVKALREHYVCGNATVRRWIGDGPVVRPETRRPVPDDFRQVAPTMLRAGLMKHYRTSDRVIERWLKETGITPLAYSKPTQQYREVPDDFTEVAPTMTRDMLRKHYHVGHCTLARWLKLSGAVAAQRVYERKPNVSSFQSTRGRIQYSGAVKIKSMYEEAADDIRRERFVVHRSTEKGAYDPEGAFWRVGNSVLTPDELLARADRYRRRAA